MSVEEEAAIKKEAEESLTMNLSLMNEVEIKKEEEASEDVCKKSGIDHRGLNWIHNLEIAKCRYCNLYAGLFINTYRN